MDDLMRRISERLAGQPSRRGLLSVLGKFAMGTAAALAAQSLFGHVADAAALMHCCSGQACADSVCPAGTSLKYTWSCGNYFCHDCFSNTEKTARGRAKYICTYSATRSVPHPHPVHHRRVVHRTTHHAPSSHGRAMPQHAPGRGQIDGM
jgi:hypothetical protein